ncbi:hypothetical protein scyTo_0013401 [Scyliorhinus torazame]|uniref:Uncharacterized protein n=1 Tax=Scyliorhinus torazame TaxID=75743 RepID=A0A401NVL3_SCYTO|nr:hypothetical protein [Scyliorhinus torazame]
MCKVKPLLHVLGQNNEMRAKDEELQLAIAETDKLALRIQELEQENAELVQEKSAVSSPYVKLAVLVKCVA